MESQVKFSFSKEISSKREKFSPTHPGKIIADRFFKKRNLTAKKVAGGYLFSSLPTTRTSGRKKRY